MLNAIIRLALRFRVAVFVLAALAAVQGIDALMRARLDVFPEFAPPMTMIQAEAPGLSASQVETLVTQPVETALAGTAGVETLRSRSLQGLSVVTLTFGDGADVRQARELVAQRLSALAGALPAGVAPPAMLPLTTTASTVLTIGLTSATSSPMALHDAAQWLLRPQLLAVPGMAEAVVFGGETRQLQVQADPAKLLRYELTLQDVLAAVRGATGVRGAGFIENANQRIALQTEGQAGTPAELEQVVLRWRGGAGIRLRDVATVAYGAAPAPGAAAIGGEPAVLMILQGQYGGDLPAVTRSLERTLEHLRPELKRQGIELHADIFRPANLIERAARHLGLVLLTGGALVMLVLALFLMDLRTALIPACAIPLSLLAAAGVLQLMGQSLNTMTLGGLAIALGEVVDDAIIDVENICRRLRENRRRAQPLPAFKVVLRASIEVRSAVVFATFIVILVFLPVLSLSGVAGRLFAPLAMAYVLAVLASLAVALTVTPALALALLGGRKPARVPRWLWRLKAAYLSLLGRTERHAGAIVPAVALACVLGIALLPFLRSSFIPELHEGHYIAHLGLAPGTSLQESMRVGRDLSRTLARIPGVRLVAQTAGRAGEVVDPAGVQLSEFAIDLEAMDGPGQERALRQIREALARLPGVTASVDTFLTERIDETISGTAAPVVVQVFGASLDQIDRKAQEVARWLGSLHGAASVRVEAPGGTPEWSIRLRQEHLARWGLRPLEVLDAVRDACQGTPAAQAYQGMRTLDLVVMLAPSARNRIEDIGALVVRNPDGRLVPLRELAEIKLVSGRDQIAHQAGQRMQAVAVTLGSRTASDFVAEARARIGREVALPQGMFVVFAGESEARAASLRELLLHGAMALAGMALLMLLAIRSRRGVALVMANLPFALVGGVLGVALSGGALSLGAMVGFITLFGISVRNAIMLVSHYEHLVHVEGLPWDRATARRGASERLVPILMTALVTALALLPLALSSGAPGNEIEGPMAAVILGGLFSSTLLNLLVLPVLALRHGRLDQGRAG